jgi:hypothetical protein
VIISWTNLQTHIITPFTAHTGVQTANIS